MNAGYALGVKKLLRLIDMTKINVALDLVGSNFGVRVLSVKSVSRADVYCLTVPSTECFAIAGGIIVSNCYDEARYYLMTPLREVDTVKIRGI